MCNLILNVCFLVYGEGDDIILLVFEANRNMKRNNLATFDNNHYLYATKYFSLNAK